MNLKRSRGLTLLMSCLINLCIGSAYSWSVLAGPLAERLTALGGAAYSASDLGIVFTVYNIPGPFCMTAGGWLNRRIEVLWAAWSWALDCWWGLAWGRCTAVR